MTLNPERLAQSGTEHAEQMALMCWAHKATMTGFHVANQMSLYNGDALKRYVNSTLGPISPVPALRWLHAIPNAGARSNKVAAAQLKAEGVKAGVADVFLPVPMRGTAPLGMTIPTLYCGLYIEMKRADGKLSDLSRDQYDFGQFVLGQGFAWVVCFGWRHAAATIEQYLSGKYVTNAA